MNIKFTEKVSYLILYLDFLILFWIAEKVSYLIVYLNFELSPVHNWRLYFIILICSSAL